MSYAVGDPWDWHVDTVVGFLCNPHGPLFSKFGNSLSREGLESAIRNNDLCGEVLLEVDDAAAKEYLGLTSLGLLIAFRRIIQSLRQQSAKWQTHTATSTELVHNRGSTWLPTVHQPRPSITSALSPFASALPAATPSAQEPQRKRVAPLLITDRVQDITSSVEATPRKVAPIVVQNDASTPNTTTESRRPADDNYDYLYHWNEASDDEILPAFGESDSDEIDSEAEVEFEEDSESDDDGTDGASVDEESVAGDDDQSLLEDRIREAQEAQLEIWRQKKLPKLESTAYQLWTGAKDRQVLQGYYSHRIETLRFRLSEIETEIKKSVSDNDPGILISVMEPTVFDIATEEWKLELFSRDEAPEKQDIPEATKPRPPRRRNRDTDEEELTSGDDYDFVVNDEEDDPKDEEEQNEQRDDSDDLDMDLIGNENSLADMPSPVPASTTNSLELDILSGETTASEEITPAETTSDQTNELETPDGNPMPAFWDIGAWKKRQSIAWSTYLVKYKDPRYFIGWNIAHDLTRWEKASSYVAKTPSEREPWSKLKTALHNLIGSDGRTADPLPGESSTTANAIMQIAIWFTCWQCKEVIKTDGASKVNLSNAARSAGGPGRDDFVDFWKVLQEINAHWDSIWETGSARRSVSERGISTPDPAPSDSVSGMLPNGELSTASAPIHKRTAKDAELDKEATPRKKVKKIKQDKKAQTQREQATLRMQQHIRNVRKIQAPELSQTGQEQVFVNPGTAAKEDLIPVNSQIAAFLKQNQRNGIAFLWRECIEAGEGALLAHTMGLGKTLQCITVLTTVMEASSSQEYEHLISGQLRPLKVAIVAPASLTENWRDEFAKWTDLPTDTLYLIDSSASVNNRRAILEQWSDSKQDGILLISYTILEKMFSDLHHDYSEKEHKQIKRILENEADIVIADEAQCLRNSKTKTANAMAGFKTPRRIALTGSPLSNNLEEYFSLINWACKDFLGPEDEFRSIYANPIKFGLYNDSTVAAYRASLKKLRALERILEPKVHRAGWEDMPDMPSKSEFTLHLPATALQRELYDTLVEMIRDRNEDENAAKKIMTSFSALKILAFHPRCFEVKLRKDFKALKRIAQEPTSSQPTPATPPHAEGFLSQEALDLVDNEPQDPFLSLQRIRTLLEIYENHSQPSQGPIPSHKLAMVVKIIEHSQDEKALVFSHSLLILNLVEETMNALGISYMRIDGSSGPVQKRQEIVKSFNNDPNSARVMLISTKAGGVGLNLFAASRVIICDDSWNPTNERQAIGRAYRLGQQKHVFVYRLMLSGSFEEALQNQTIFKEQLASRVVEKKNPKRFAVKDFGKFLRPLQRKPQVSSDGFVGKDPKVLDRLLENESILRIQIGEEFTSERRDPLTKEEEVEVEAELVRRETRRSGKNMPMPVRGASTLNKPTIGAIQLPGSMGRLPTAVSGLNTSQNIRTVPIPVVHARIPNNVAPLITSPSNLQRNPMAQSVPLPLKTPIQVIDLIGGDSTSEDDIIRRPVRSVEKDNRGISSQRPLSVSSDSEHRLRSTVPIANRTPAEEAYWEARDQPVDIRRQNPAINGHGLPGGALPGALANGVRIPPGSIPADSRGNTGMSNRGDIDVVMGEGGVPEQNRQQSSSPHTDVESVL